MRRTIIMGCLCAAFILSAGSLFHGVGAQEPAQKPNPKDRPKKATRREAAPTTGNAVKGATVKGNSVQLKSGYRFVQTNPSTVSVQDVQANNTVGSFECNCLSEGGRCSPKVKGTGMKCVSSSNCRNNCQIKIIYSATSPEIVPR